MPALLHCQDDISRLWARVMLVYIVMLSGTVYIVTTYVTRYWFNKSNVSFNAACVNVLD